MVPRCRAGWPLHTLRSAVITGVLTCGLAMVVLRHGLAVSPDGWTYWASSVSLLEGDGYRDAHGLAVDAWPPGYPLWLAFVQHCLDVSIRSVRVADATALGLAAALASAFFLGRTRAEGGPHWPVIAFTTSIASTAARGVSSEYLMLALLLSTLLAVEWFRSAEGGVARALALGVAALAGALMVNTRHAAMAFVPALMVVIGTTRRLPLRIRLAAAGALGGAIGGSWAVVRCWLGQHASHAEPGHRALLGITWDMIRGIDRCLAPFPLGAVVFFGGCVWLADRARHVRRAPELHPRSQLHVVGFVAMSLVAVGAMFCVVHVADAPGQRFVRFAPLLIGGLLVGHARGSPRGWRRTAVLLLLLLPNALRACKHVVVGRSAHDNVTADGGEAFLHGRTTLAPRTGSRVPRPGDCVAVEAPWFSWQREGRVTVTHPETR
jgi:hypothetical protein